MCKISLLILGSVQRGGFTSDWSGLFTMKACKVKMITMLSAKFAFSQTGMRPNYCRGPMKCFHAFSPGVQRVWSFFYIALPLFSASSTEETKTVSLKGQTSKMNVFTVCLSHILRTVFPFSIVFTSLTFCSALLSVYHHHT